MDFFESQDRARRDTTRLLLLYFLAIVLILVSLYSAAVLAFEFGGIEWRQTEPAAPEGWLHYWDWVFFGYVVLIVGSIIVCGSLYRMMQLRGHGGKVAELLGGTPVTPSSDDPAAKRLINVVEEMSIASGVPVPAIYILEEERNINAFAAGTEIDNAAIAVTRGAIETLDRDELQGVIAHEFSHILNGDMKLNVRLLGLLNGILLLHLIGIMPFRLLSHGSSRRRGYGRRGVILSSGGGGSRGRGRGGGGGGGGLVIAILVIAIALTVIGYIGVVFARLIQSAVSRKREYLADAAAVQFTRNPSGLSGALKKIGGAVLRGRIDSAHATEASHFFFANPLTRSATNLFATHPPLKRRIRMIDPAFDGKFPVVKRPPPAEPVAAADAAPNTGKPRKSAFGGAGAAGAITDAIPIRPDVLLATIGILADGHRQRAADILNDLPKGFRDAAHTPLGAKALVYLLLLSPDESVRGKQLDLIREKADPRVPKELEKLLPGRDALRPEGRLPLLDLSFPALKELSPDQYEHFKGMVRELIAADEKVSLFEFCLERCLFERLDRHFASSERKPPQLHAFQAVTGEINLLLSALAHAGEKDSQKALANASGRLSMLADRLMLIPEEACTAEAIKEALDKLAQITPPMKKRFMDAATFCVASDGALAVEEGELLRAVAESLGCPMPPILGGIRDGKNAGR